MHTRKIILPLVVVAGMLLASCGNKEKKYDATGTFEATETTVFAEESGQLMKFDVAEGSTVEAGSEVGLIDTTQISLKIAQLMATKAVYASQRPDMEKQIAATRQQLQKARQEQQRYAELVKDGAAPSKMLDDMTSQVSVLQKQLDAQVSSLNTQLSTLSSQQSAVDVQVSQLRDQLRKCHLKAPAGGTVLEKYVEQGEFVATGKPLFKIGDVDNMFLRAYVTSSQLEKVTLGRQVTVFADYGGGHRKEYVGRVTWISSQAEFTPKTILTDDERADLVYAVRVSVKNDGGLKIGMYGELALGD